MCDSYHECNFVPMTSQHNVDWDKNNNKLIHKNTYVCLICGKKKITEQEVNITSGNN